VIYSRARRLGETGHQDKDFHLRDSCCECFHRRANDENLHSDAEVSPKLNPQLDRVKFYLICKSHCTITLDYENGPAWEGELGAPFKAGRRYLSILSLSG